MTRVFRAIIAVFVFVATLYFVSLLFIIVLPENGGFSFVGILASYFFAFLASRFVASRIRLGADRGAWFSSVVSGALIVGAVGFVLGFVGPMILTPEANQGPLLGIFMTGPAGVLLGAIAGFIYWRMTSQHTSTH